MVQKTIYKVNMAEMTTTKTLTIVMDTEAAPLVPSSGPVEEEAGVPVGADAPVEASAADDVTIAVGLAPVELEAAAPVELEAAAPVEEEETAGTNGKVWLNARAYM